MLHIEIGWFDKKENSADTLPMRLANDATFVRAAFSNRLSIFIQDIAAVSVPLLIGMLLGWRVALVALATLPVVISAIAQTRSGKTYTMGTACKEGSPIGIIPRAMASLFDKIEKLKNQVEFQLRVSFIEILKEEVRDLLDPAAAVVSKILNGVITLAGSTEVHVSTF